MPTSEFNVAGFLDAYTTAKDRLEVLDNSLVEYFREFYNAHVRNTELKFPDCTDQAFKDEAWRVTEVFPNRVEFMHQCEEHSFGNGPYDREIVDMPFSWLIDPVAYDAELAAAAEAKRQAHEDRMAELAAASRERATKTRRDLYEELKAEFEPAVEV